MVDGGGGGGEDPDLLPLLLETEASGGAHGLADLVERHLLFVAEADQHHPPALFHAIGVVEWHNFKIVRLEILFVHHLTGDLADGERQAVALTPGKHRND